MRLIDKDKIVRYTCKIDRDHDYEVYDIEHAHNEYKYVTEDSIEREKGDHYFGIEVTKTVTL